MLNVNAPWIQWCTKCLPASADAEINKLFNETEHTTWSAYSNDNEVYYGFQVTAVIALALGFGLCFFGWPLFYLTLILSGFLLFFGTAFGVFCGATNSWLAAILIGSFGGIVVGILIAKYEKLGAVLTGAGAGALAYLWSNAFWIGWLYHELPQSHQSWVPPLLLALFCVIGALLAVAFEKPLIIIATAFGGAFAMGFGVERLAWGASQSQQYLNPVVLLSGSGCHSWDCYGSFIAVGVVGVLGVLVQHHMSKDKKYETRFAKQNTIQYEGGYLDLGSPQEPVRGAARPAIPAGAMVVSSNTKALL